MDKLLTIDTITGEMKGKANIYTKVAAKNI
jgi:hypothetical protein